VWSKVEPGKAGLDGLLCFMVGAVVIWHMI